MKDDILPRAGMSAKEIAVYADFLMERSEPLGEFITLSLNSEDSSTARRAELLRHHERQWLGELTSFLENVEYENGLPCAATLKRKATKPSEAVLQHPLLRTVRRLLSGKTTVRRMGRSSPLAYLASLLTC